MPVASSQNFDVGDKRARMSESLASMPEFKTPPPIGAERQSNSTTMFATTTDECRYKDPDKMVEIRGRSFSVNSGLDDLYLASGMTSGAGSEGNLPKNPHEQKTLELLVEKAVDIMAEKMEVVIEKMFNNALQKAFYKIDGSKVYEEAVKTPHKTFTPRKTETPFKSEALTSRACQAEALQVKSSPSPKKKIKVNPTLSPEKTISVYETPTKSPVSQFDISALLPPSSGCTPTNTKPILTYISPERDVKMYTTIERQKGERKEKLNDVGKLIECLEGFSLPKTHSRRGSSVIYPQE